jgi:hypothetical protein
MGTILEFIAISKNERDIRAIFQSHRLHSLRKCQAKTKLASTEIDKDICVVTAALQYSYLHCILLEA